MFYFVFVVLSLFCFKTIIKKNKKKRSPGYVGCREELKWIVGPFLMRRPQDLDDDDDDDVGKRFNQSMYLKAGQTTF